MPGSPKVDSSPFTATAPATSQATEQVTTGARQDYENAKLPTSPNEIQGLIASGALTLASIQGLRSQPLTSDVRAALDAAEKKLAEKDKTEVA